MAFVDINRDTCIKCGACAAVCPAGLFDYQKNEYPEPLPHLKKSCIRCGHCVAVCPTGSVLHLQCPLDKCLPLQKEQGVAFEQCAQLLKGRRSIRAYQDKPVSREVIERLIDVARYAPTGGNSQGVRWMVFDDKEQLRRFAEIGLAWMRREAQTGPLAEAKMADVIRLSEAGRDGFLRNAPVLVLALGEKNNPAAKSSCTIALTYLELAAAGMGLGAMWAGFFMFAEASFPDMIKELALPDNLMLHGAMTVGYSSYKYQRIPVRRPVEISWKP